MGKMQLVSNAIGQLNSTRTLCVWASGTLLHHSSIPCARDQQQCLFQQLSQQAAKWEYDDGDDKITIVNLEDLIEACAHSAQSVLHIQSKAHKSQNSRNTQARQPFQLQRTLDCNDHLNQVVLGSPRSVARSQLQPLVVDAVTVANGLSDNATEETARLVVDAVTVANDLSDNEFVNVDSSGCTATHYQSMGKIDEFRQMASQLRPTDLRKQLHEHSESGDLQKVSVCLHVSADRVWLANATKGFGSTPLIAAAKKDHADIVRALLEADANPMATNWFGKSAMEYANEYSQKHPDSF